MSELAVAAAAAKKTPTIEDELRKREPEIARALGASIDPAEFMQNAITVLRTNPGLMRASLPSLLGGLYLAAQLKLRVGGLAPQVHLTPRTVGGEQVVVPIVDYRGYIALAHNTGRFSKIEAFTVHEHDEFDRYADGQIGQTFTHRPAKGDRGPIIGVIGLALIKGADAATWIYLDRDEVESDHRPKSWERTPWKTNERAMYRKTAMRELFKWIPSSTEMALAAAEDETVVRKIDGIPELVSSPAVEEVVDGEIVPDDLDPADPRYQAPEDAR